MAHDLDRFVAYWQRRKSAYQEASDRLARQARDDLVHIVRMLRQRFGVRRILLFGSLAHHRFAPGSDIDLAVEGLSKRDFFIALTEANRLSRFWIDLKPLEDLEPRFRERVLSTGEDLL